MIADQFVLKAFEDVDKALELSLQQSSLIGAKNNVTQDQQSLKLLQDQLWIVKSEVDSLTTNIRQRRSRSRPNLMLMRSVLQNIHIDLPTGFNADEDPSSSIVPAVQNAIIRYVTLCCYYTIVQESLQQLPDLSATQDYFSEVATSKKWSLLYGLQILPERAFRFASAVVDDTTSRVSRPSNHVTHHWRSIQARDLATTATRWAHQILPRWDKLLMIHNYQLVGIPRNTSKMITSLWGLPLAVVREEVDSMRAAAENRFDQMTRKLGELISEFPLKNNEQGRIESLATYFEVQSPSEFSLASKTLVDLTSRTIDLSSPKPITKPGKLTRYWPTVLCTLVYGPSSIITLWKARYKILQFCRDNIVEFCAGLVYNWIWVPLQQVWSTVRHDEQHSPIAVMSQGSLDTEFGSLSRMVVQLVAENSDGNVDIDLLTKQVELGNLTQFMQIYETQLHHPIKNILTGKLVRSLLIQLQKTKVDGSLALNGIDKLLQSQQLVFGVVAMSPALLIIYCLVTGIYRLIKLGRIWSNIGLFKLKLSSSMNNVERLLNYHNLEPEHRDENLNTGLLALEIVSARLYGEKLIPKKRKSEWLRDVDELVDANLSHLSKLNVVNRLYHVYGRYF